MCNCKCECRCEKKGLSLEVGKSYRARNGKIYMITEYKVIENDDVYLFRTAAGLHMSFTPDGKYWADGRYSEYDLIELVEEAPAKPKTHIHAELMAKYAEDARETDKPWERWQHRGSWDLPDRWWDCTTHPIWAENLQYRRKPQKKIYEKWVHLWKDGSHTSGSWYNSYEEADAAFPNRFRENLVKIEKITWGVDK